jgi:hypothetical protein
MSTTSPIPSFSIPITQKLSKTNFLVWRLQILPLIRAAQLEDIFTGAEKMPAKLISVKTGDTTSEEPNPEYIRWMARDQALLGYLLSSLTREVHMSLTTITTSTAAWSTLHEMFGTRTRVKSVNTRIRSPPPEKVCHLWPNIIPR